MHLRSSRNLSLITLSLLSLAFTGCFHTDVQHKPATITAPGIVVLEPDQIQTTDQIAKALAVVAKAYRDDIDGNNLDKAKIDRNRFVFTIMGQIEASYGDYEHSFRSKRAIVETVADAGLLGVTAAATVVGETGIKDMLTAASVAGSGTKLSAEKNFFNEEGTVALLTQMRASRSAIEAQIIQRCGTPVSSYSLEEAWKDLNKYVNAGSVESAMIQLAAAAGSQNVQAQQAVDDAVISVTTPATDQDLVSSKKARAIAVSLITAITPRDGSTPDPAKSQKAAEAITNILTNSDAAPPPGSTAPQLAKMLEDKMRLSSGNTVARGKLYTELLAAPTQFGGTGQ